MSNAAKVLKDALDLEPQDRVRVAAALMRSLGPPPGWTDAGWQDELRRRVEQLQRTGSQGRPWSDVRRDVEAKLRSRRRRP